MTVSDLDALLTRLEANLAAVEELDEPVRELVFELLDGIDAVHRGALRALGEAVGAQTIDRVRAAHPAIAWLLEAYAVGVDEVSAADAALEQVRPYISSHGGRVDVLGAEAGVVRLRMSGACSGCTASAATLTEGIEEALREHYPGFVAIDVEPDDAPAHPPPPTTALVQIGPRPAGL